MGWWSEISWKDRAQEHVNNWNYNVILVVCCWRNFCLDCSSDSCLDALEWKSAPIMPRDKPQNCQKRKATLLFISQNLEFKMKSPQSPTAQKNHSTVQYCATENKTSISPQKASRWDTGVSHCPDTLWCNGTLVYPVAQIHSVSLHTVEPNLSNPTSGHDQERGKHPFRLTRCQSKAILLNSIFTPHFLPFSRKKYSVH